MCTYACTHTQRNCNSDIWCLTATATGIKLKLGGISYVTAKPAQKQYCRQKYNYLSIMNPGETALWNTASRQAAQKKSETLSFSG